MSPGFSTLPNELVHTLGTFIRPEDLPSFVLVDKTINISATPHLYHNVDLSLSKFYAVRSFIETLASPSDSLALQRPLATLVHHLKIGYAELNPPFIYTNDPVPAIVPNAVVRGMLSSMVNLRTLTVDDDNGLTHCGPVILHALITTPHPDLTSIAFPMHGCGACDDLLTSPLPSGLALLTPRLRQVTISSSVDESSPAIPMLHQLLLAHSAQLELVSLPTMESQVLTIEPSTGETIANIPFPALQDLEIDALTITHPFSKIFNHAKSLDISDIAFPDGHGHGGVHDMDDWHHPPDLNNSGESDSSDDSEDATSATGDPLGSVEDAAGTLGSEISTNEAAEAPDNDHGGPDGGSEQSETPPPGDWALDAPLVPEDLWPNLEKLSCPTNILASFLSADVPPRARRPIHSVRLSVATYDFHAHDFDTDDIPSWPHLLRILESLHYSAVPIRELSFAVKQIEMSPLTRLVRQHTELEFLLIMTDIFAIEPTPVRASIAQRLS